jgi:hypothetical protein
MQGAMLNVCPVDGNILTCLMHYQPEVLLLGLLAIVCLYCLWN